MTADEWANSPDEPGTLDPTSQPTVRNADGSVSTVRSISIGTPEGEVLIPTVSPDGKVLTDKDAIAQYQRTGKHLGIFKSPAAATAYAKSLHDSEESRVSAEAWANSPDDDAGEAWANSRDEDADSATWWPEITAMGVGALTGIPGGMGGGAIGTALGTLAIPLVGPAGPAIGGFLGSAAGSGLTGGLGYRFTEATMEGRDPLEDMTPGGLAMDAALGVAIPAAVMGVGRGLKHAFSPIAKSAATTIAPDDLLRPLQERALQAQNTMLGAIQGAPDVIPGVKEGFFRQIANQNPGLSKLRIASKAMMSSPLKSVRAAGEALTIEQQADDLLNSWATNQKSDMLASLAKPEREAYSAAFRDTNLARMPLSGPTAPGTIDDAVRQYATTVQEAHRLKRAFNIQEKVGGQWVPVRDKANYVYGRLKEEYRPSTKGTVLGLRMPWAPDPNAKTLAALQKAGITDPTKIRELMSRETATGLYEHEAQQFPNFMYDQAIDEIWSPMQARDTAELAGALTWGGGKPALLATKESGELPLPELAKDMIEHLTAKGRTAEAKLLEGAMRQLHTLHSDPSQAQLGFLRKLSGNMALASNFWLQLSELWTGSAFGGGVSSVVRGRRIFAANPLLQKYAGAATGSDIPAMMGKSVMDSQKRLLGIPSPIAIAGKADSFTRKIAYYSALDMTDRVARVGHALTQKGAKIPAALLKEAEEVMGSPRGSGKQALDTLVREFKANGMVPPELHIMGGQNLTKRWLYSWGPGQTPEAMSTGWGAVALQFRNYAVQAWRHFADDIQAPIVEGAKELTKTGDGSLLKLGAVRFMRLVGHQLAPAVAFGMIRQIADGKEPDPERILGNMMSRTFGLRGDLLMAGIRAAQDKPFQLERIADVPVFSQTLGAGRDLLQGAGRGDGGQMLQGAHTLAQGAVPQLGYLQGPRRMLVGK